jgi:branched-chain amino acid transport system substrate-binding protein
MLFAAVLAGMVLLAGLAGCKDKKDTVAPIKVGLDLPFSDAMGPMGKGVMDGVNLRVEEINQAGGINGRKIVLVTEDNKGDKTAVRNAFKKLVQDGVVAVIGPIKSTNALAVKMDADGARVPLITPTATNDKVTENSSFIVRACYADSFQGLLVAEYALKDLGCKKAATLIDMNSDYSKGLTATFKKQFEAGGGKVVAEPGYQQKDTDFGSQLARIKDSGAEILFVPGYPPELPLIIKQARVVGLTCRLCGADGWDNPAVLDQAGDNIEGCFYVAGFSPQDPRPIVQQFVANMTKSTGRSPGTFEALGYDSMLLLEAGLRKTVEPEALAKALRELKDIDAVSGRITITPAGDAVKSAVVLKATRQGEHFVGTLVKTVSPEGQMQNAK